jgi:Cu(I)/Ag(I) efflux system membrane fusion protein
MRKFIQNKWFLIAAVLLLGFAIGKFTSSGEKQTATQEVHTHEGESTSEIWTCSMHPQIQKNGPGQCPLCGMDLIPLDNSMEGKQTLPDEVPMSASAIALAEIQTIVVHKQKSEKEIRLLGKVKPDERLMYNQAVHLPGRIERLYINFTGEKVYRGQKLASLYSPEFVTAQKELFEVLKDKSTNPYLVKAAREKIKQWKFTDKQIDAIIKRGTVQININILSDYSGYIVKRMVTEGDHVKEGQILFDITDLRKVWVLFEAYENDLPWVKLGDKLDFELKSIPGTTFNGKVTFIDPFINSKTRVAYVRVELSNKKGLLKPEMFANGIVTSKLDSKEDVILVPKSAVLWTGKRAVVYVKLPNREHHSFIYREVILGEETSDSYIIKTGLTDGEEIATHGVFKIDASAQLVGKQSMMNPTASKVSTGHNHGGHNSELGTMDTSTSKIMIDKLIVPTTFKKQLGDVVTSYLALKNKLADDDSNIKYEVKTIENALNKVDRSLVLGDAHNVWMKALRSLKNDLKLLASEVNIDAQRKHFLRISKTLSYIVQKIGIQNDKTIYVEFCSMADDDKGGYWLSTEKEINNPYYGKIMSQCGEIKAVIK